MTARPDPHEQVPTDPGVRPAPLAALDLERMPSGAHFRRDHFSPAIADPAAWRLGVGGSVGRPLELGFERLRSYPRRELRVVLECSGHRRAEYRPATRGVPWQLGAVSEAVWAGASLRDLLEDASVSDAAQFIVLEGADRGPFRGEGDVPFARALPLEKALHPDTLLAWEMNGEPLPLAHGAPLRAIVPGWYATDSVKRLGRIAALEEPFDGPFEAIDYRVDGERLTALRVHALLTSAREGEQLAAGDRVLRGIAWGGEGGVARVEVSVDRSDWEQAALDQVAGPYAFARWNVSWPAEPGLHTVAVRATDAAGATQPPEPVWNEGGYANSSIQRVRLHVV